MRSAKEEIVGGAEWRRGLFFINRELVPLLVGWGRKFVRRWLFRVRRRYIGSWADGEEGLGRGTCLVLGEYVLLGVSDERFEEELVANVDRRYHRSWRCWRSDVGTSSEPSRAPGSDPVKNPTRLGRVLCYEIR